MLRLPELAHQGSFATNVRKTKVTAKVVICELQVIQPEQAKNRGMQIV